MLPLSNFLSFVHENDLFQAPDKILLAVSGGKDSVLMARLFNDAGFNFGIAHCNFGLRGSDSDADEAFVKSLAQQYEAPFYTTRFDTEKIAASNTVSIQMAARDLRYSWFEELRYKHSYDYVAVAHHQNDVVETVLLNLVRGTGIAGMHGILPKRGKIIRPLLFLKTEEINSLVSDNSIAYREDASNSSTKYARNKIRHEVVPHLKSLNPLLEQTFDENSKRFRELEVFLNQQVQSLRSDLFKISSLGDIHILIAQLKELQPQALLFFELFKPYNFTEPVLKDLAASLEKQSGKVFRSATHQLLLDREVLILQQFDKTDRSETVVLKQQERAEWAGCNFVIKEVEGGEIIPFANSNMAFFDEAMLQFPVKIRQWNNGDFFHPFGMKGKKKLSDFFTGLKIPVSQKKDIPVLENGNGDIIWVAGFRPDERYKVTGFTKKVVIFEKYNIDEH